MRKNFYFFAIHSELKRELINFRAEMKKDLEDNTSMNSRDVMSEI